MHLTKSENHFNHNVERIAGKVYHKDHENSNNGQNVFKKKLKNLHHRSYKQMLILLQK